VRGRKGRRHDQESKKKPKTVDHVWDGSFGLKSNRGASTSTEILQSRGKGADLTETFEIRKTDNTTKVDWKPYHGELTKRGKNAVVNKNSVLI